MTMNVDVEQLSPCRKRLTIEIPAERVDAEYDAVLIQYTKSARIKGFRPGKAPSNVVRARYAGQILQDVKERLIPEGYRTALKQASLDPVAVLDVKEETLEPRKPFSFTVTCDVAPDFELPIYKGIPLSRNVEPVSTEQIDGAVDRVKDQFASFEDVDREVRTEDLVCIDFEGTIDGRSLIETAPSAKGLERGTDFWMQAGEHAFLPEFGEAVIGTRAGDEKTIDVCFPDTFHDKALQGKQASYTVKVKLVRERVISPLTEDQLRTLGVSTEEEFRDRVAADLGRQRDRAETQRLRNEIVSELLHRTRLDVPESVVAEETRQTVYDMVRNVTRQGGGKEVVEERRDEIFDIASRSAAEKVKVRYILKRIAGEEHLTVADADVSARIEAMAAGYGVSRDALRAELQKRGQIENLEQDLLFEKTLDFLLEEATV